MYIKQLTEYGGTTPRETQLRKKIITTIGNLDTSDLNMIVRRVTRDKKIEGNRQKNYILGPLLRTYPAWIC